ncbi:hypothetical protein GH733_010532 [Mirounga leonina]|nr:hypothetical protein GH733_010532 [Mirounga leonina]
MPGKRIAVIGAGVSGLGAIKTCLEEGLEPICFEGSDDIGGLWRYEEKAKSGRPSIYESATSNTSKEMTTYSDYPFPDHFPNYLHNSRIMEYLRMYVQHFHLTKYIRFLVRIKRFKGQYIHSWDYKSPEKFRGKKIIVVGIGNSGADLAVELSHVASQVWCFSAQGGVHGFGTRFLSHQPTFSDDLHNHIISGRVLIKPNVKGFMETSAIFEDGTGYTFSFPFLENNSTVLDSQRSMFKYVFPPQLEKPTWLSLASSSLWEPPFPHWSSRADGPFVFLNNPGDTRRVQYVDYMDEIASEIGVKPKLLSLFLWDPKLAMEIFFGPCTPYQYRLSGPGKWAGAQRAILTQRARIIKPLRTRTLTRDQPPYSVPCWLKRACAALLFVLNLVTILSEAGPASGPMSGNKIPYSISLTRITPTSELTSVKAHRLTEKIDQNAYLCGNAIQLSYQDLASIPLVTGPVNSNHCSELHVPVCLTRVTLVTLHDRRSLLQSMLASYDLKDLPDSTPGVILEVLPGQKGRAVSDIGLPLPSPLRLGAHACGTQLRGPRDLLPGTARSLVMGIGLLGSKVSSQSRT